MTSNKTQNQSHALKSLVFFLATIWFCVGRRDEHTCRYTFRPTKYWN